MSFFFYRFCFTSFVKEHAAQYASRLMKNDHILAEKVGIILKTNVRKYDNFKLYYWHGATLVGKYRLPQLAPTQAIPSKVIFFNERKGITKPEEY